jgi:hypothetical protein
MGRRKRPLRFERTIRPCCPQRCQAVRFAYERQTPNAKRRTLSVERPSPRYHQMFQGPQYGPKSWYIEASSLICAASIWSWAMDCWSANCLYF